MNINIIALLIFGIVPMVVSFHLEPVKMSNIHFDNFVLNIKKTIIADDISLLISNNIKNTKIHGITNDFINTISKEIFFAIDVTDTKVTHKKWIFNITPSQGTMHIYSIEATIGKQNVISGIQKVVFNIKSIRLEQTIPAVYDVREHCASTGSRRYGFCGPRSRKCNTYHVPRGLNNNEIAQVTTALMAKAEEAKKMLA
ncbi:hypothetical protein QJ857_gp0332 [Tupanvirus soda lake]|uniref:Uncharacterized protein n=2 Tax=Tupanvirus TaxID=2094720 RepID=A0A6N1NTH7_9VIRU|nr:hypothetical protein QJ857_gp0332 [Tupanvirus soda lake]QKU35697.1 hypothetical protein [Tupanvirus soda lake]